jgi:hypothetical protein
MFADRQLPSFHSETFDSEDGDNIFLKKKKESMNFYWTTWSQSQKTVFFIVTAAIALNTT